MASDLIEKGYAVAVKVGGRWRRLPGGLLHDESGRMWPKHSALVLPVPHKPSDPIARGRRAREYFGDAYAIHGARLELPDKALSHWKAVGKVEAIDYTRRGKYAGDFRHPFGKSPFAMFFPGLKKRPTLLVCRCEKARAYRIELGPTAIWDWRGIVRP